MNKTLQVLEELKNADQDFEWYPTTQEMIDVVKKHIPESAESILDIGAGDGRVLEAFGEKCPNAPLYSIEISPILVQKQDRNIIPVGTNFHEQSLFALPVGYIFSNPKYSEYEEWTKKIIEEGYAKCAFVIIPQRWKESGIIQKALKKRKATTRVIYSGDFLGADRASRAMIDIVEISFPRSSQYEKRVADAVLNPFDIWFEQTVFIEVKEKEEEYISWDEREQLKKDKAYSYETISDMVAAYKEEYANLEENYRRIFQMDPFLLMELQITKEKVCGSLKGKMKNLKLEYWNLMFMRLDAITSRLTKSTKEIFMSKLIANTIVEFTESNAYAIVLWAIKNANYYYDDQLVELFKEFSTHENVMAYKSNQKTWKENGWRYNNMSRYDFRQEAKKYMLDYRIVHDGWRAIYKGLDLTGYYHKNLHQDCHNLIGDVVAVLGNLGFSTSFSLSSYHRDWVAGKWENWYESGPEDKIIFQVKAYLNGNLHFRFSPEAIQALNIEAARILKWVENVEDVIIEMGYSPRLVKKYFGYNKQLNISNVKLLGDSGYNTNVLDKEEKIEEKVEGTNKLEEETGKQLGMYFKE